MVRSFVTARPTSARKAKRIRTTIYNSPTTLRPSLPSRPSLNRCGHGKTISASPLPLLGQPSRSPPTVNGAEHPQGRSGGPTPLPTVHRRATGQRWPIPHRRTAAPPAPTPPGPNPETLTPQTPLRGSGRTNFGTAHEAPVSSPEPERGGTRFREAVHPRSSSSSHPHKITHPVLPAASRAEILESPCLITDIMSTRFCISCVPTRRYLV